MKRIFTQDLPGKTVADAKLERFDNTLVLKFTDGSVYALSLERGWYGECYFNDEDAEVKLD